jgi:hypothetical protein
MRDFGSISRLCRTKWAATNDLSLPVRAFFSRAFQQEGSIT